LRVEGGRRRRRRSVICHFEKLRRLEEKLGEPGPEIKMYRGA
jgi:hypothetical protein